MKKGYIILIIILIPVIFIIFSIREQKVRRFRSPIGAGDTKWHKFVTPHRKTLDMGSYTMHYIDIGKGEPVVMVHGMMLSTYSWRNNIHSLLDAGFRVILINLPGHGLTEIPSESYTYTIEQISSDIVTMTSKLGFKQFHLIGHSLGAGVTLYTSFHYPQYVRKAIVNRSTCFWASSTSPAHLSRHDICCICLFWEMDGQIEFEGDV